MKQSCFDNKNNGYEYVMNTVLCYVNVKLAKV